MPADLQTVREIALALPGVEEGVCFGTSAFYVGRKLMLRLWEDAETLVVRYPKEQREALIDTNPDVFFVTDHYQNYPAVLINLLAVNRKLLGEMIEGAWRMQASKKVQSTREIPKAATSKPTSTFENEVLGVLAYEFPFSNKAETERKIKGRLQRKKLGKYDQERIDLLRRLKDELQLEIGRAEKSCYYTGRHGRYCDMLDSTWRG